MDLPPPLVKGHFAKNRIAWERKGVRQLERTLDALAVGQSATVAGLGGPDRRRLMELGFVPGEKVENLGTAPWGDPVAYGVCGAVVALRRADAKHIAIEK
jgi:Fe2+ transport system protein FeoA